MIWLDLVGVLFGSCGELRKKRKVSRGDMLGELYNSQLKDLRYKRRPMGENLSSEVFVVEFW